MNLAKTLVHFPTEKNLKNLERDAYDEVHNCKKTGKKAGLGVEHSYWFRTMTEAGPVGACTFFHLFLIQQALDLLVC